MIGSFVFFATFGLFFGVASLADYFIYDHASKQAPNWSPWAVAVFSIGIGTILAIYLTRRVVWTGLTLMPLANQNYSKRDYLLPEGCKDLADAIKREEESVLPPVPDPPIVKHVTLPAKVSVGYLAEVTGQELARIIDELVGMKLFLGMYRSIDFQDASKLLRKYGISASREL
jgi:hypothetical protein